MSFIIRSALYSMCIIAYSHDVNSHLQAVSRIRLSGAVTLRPSTLHGMQRDLTKYSVGDQVKKDEMSGACATRGAKRNACDGESRTGY